MEYAEVGAEGNDALQRVIFGRANDRRQSLAGLSWQSTTAGLKLLF